jgi:hypothetical protein
LFQFLCVVAATLAGPQNQSSAMDDPIDAPPLHWFLRDASRRRKAWQYWGRDMAWGLLFASSHHALRLTSIDTCSMVGDFYGGLARRLNFQSGEMRGRGRTGCC